MEVKSIKYDLTAAGRMWAFIELYCSKSSLLHECRFISVFIETNERKIELKVRDSRPRKNAVHWNA